MNPRPPSSWDAILRDLREDEEAPPAPAPARIGRYAVLKTLGATRSSTVYLASDPDLRRNVAIKVLREDRALPEFVRRFEREGAFTASLRHSGLIAIHEVGRWTEPDKPALPFIVMDYHEGGTLAGRRLDAAPAAELLAAVGEALGHAHRHGIVHRDLKPENILLDSAGLPVVTDFGLARDLDGSTRETQAGTLMGTPRYMAPEQVSGDTAAIDLRSDVHALGAILYELLTGRPPFTAENPSALFHQILTEDPPAPSSLAPGIPEALDAVVLKALEKDRALRYAGAAEFAADLRLFLRNEPVSARRRSAGVRIRKWAGRHRTAVAVLAGLAAAASLIVIYSGWNAAHLPVDKPPVPVPVPAPPPARPARWVDLDGSGSGAGISKTPTSSFDCCVLVDREDRPVVAWREYAGKGIWLRRWSGTRWEDVGSSASGGGFGLARKAENPRLAIGRDRRLLLSWDDDSAGRSQIFLVEWDGAAWGAIDGSGSGTGLSRSAGHARFASLATEKSGRATVAWQDNSSGRWQIHLRRSDGGAWVELGGSATGGGVSAGESSCTLPSVALDASGNPAVSWLDHGESGYRIRLRRWTGKDWGPVLEPPNGAVQPAGEDGWSVDRTAIAFDARGRLMLAWSPGHSGSGGIRFALHDGIAWQELDGSATGTPLNRTTNAGEVCMAVDAAGRPILAWSDATADARNIYLKRWNGASWEELAGSATDGGISDSSNRYSGGAWVSLTSAGEPVVAWSQHSEKPPGDEILLKMFTSKP